MKNLRNSILTLLPLAAALSVPAAYGQSNQPQSDSAKSSKVSGTDAKSERSAISDQPPAASMVNACSAAADELLESRRLVVALETANSALSERLETEKQVSALLTKANDAREAETRALRTAIAAKDETITAKDALIENRRQMIELLKKRSNSPFKRIADVLIGAAIFAILK